MVRDKYKKPQCHLKICEKLKIIALYEESKIPMRKFGDQAWFEGWTCNDSETCNDSLISIFV